jgi:predicted naringenin-chalcone synthase
MAIRPDSDVEADEACRFVYAEGGADDRLPDFVAMGAGDSFERGFPPMSFAIWGLGTALPDQSITQELAAELSSKVSGHDADQTRRLAALYRRSGVRKRHVALLDRLDVTRTEESSLGASTRERMEHYEQAVRPLAREASRQALANSGVAAIDITHLVTVSCTGFAAPGFDLGLFTALGLDPGVQRTHVGFMGCHGALNGLRVASAFAGSDPSARILLCAAELCSLHFRFGFDSEQIVSNALFADGAAAIVGRAGEPAGRDPWRLVASGSTLMPETLDAMSWKIGDNGFAMTLSTRVPSLIAENLRPWLEGWLGRQGLGLSEIRSWAIHPGGPKILDAVEEALGLDRSATAESRDVLANQGNMSSPTVLFILDRLRHRQAPRPCVSLAFGPGLAVEVALFL